MTKMHLQLDELFDVERLRERIAEGVDVNQEISPRRYPLDTAIEKGRLDICRILLDAGANANRAAGWNDDGYGAYDPLWWVIATRHESRSTREEKKQWIDMLLGAGAKIGGADPDWICCPLYAAAVNGNVDAFAILLDAGADLNSARRPGAKNYGPIPLIEKLAGSNQEICLLLLRRGYDDSFFSIGMPDLTPFQAAVKRGRNEVVNYYLSERGEDPAQRTDAGRTMFQIAGNDETKQLLRAYKTQLAIANAVERQDGGKPVVVAAKRSRGMTTL